MKGEKRSWRSRQASLASWHPGVLTSWHPDILTSWHSDIHSHVDSLPSRYVMSLSLSQSVGGGLREREILCHLTDPLSPDISSIIDLTRTSALIIVHHR